MTQQQPDMKDSQCEMFLCAAFQLFFLVMMTRTLTVIHSYYVKLQYICAVKERSKMLSISHSRGAVSPISMLCSTL